MTACHVYVEGNSDLDHATALQPLKEFLQSLTP